MELNYQDTVTLIDTAPNEYGTEVITNSVSVPAMVLSTTTALHASNQDAIGTTSVVYLDPTNPFVVENAYRLEEMLLVIDIYGGPEKETWYKIENVTVARDVLLSNQIDNMFVELKKTSEIVNVS